MEDISSQFQRLQHNLMLQWREVVIQLENKSKVHVCPYINFLSISYDNDNCTQLIDRFPIRTSPIRVSIQF